MNKKLNVIVLAIIFGLIGSTITYFLNLNKLNKIDTEITLEFHYIGENLYPKIIETNHYDKLLLDRFMPDLRRMMDAEILRLFHKYNKIYNFHYARKNSKTHAFSIIGFDHEKDKKNLMKIKDLIMNEFKDIILKDIIDNNNLLIKRVDECKLLKKRNVYEKMNITEKNVASFFSILNDKKNKSNKNLMFQKNYLKEMNNILKEIRRFNSIYLDQAVPCEMFIKQMNNGNLIIKELDKLTTYNMSTQKKYIIKDFTFILLRGFINGILFFIFIKLSIMYFKK